MKELPLLEKEYDEEKVRSREFWEQQELTRVSLSSFTGSGN